MPELQPVSLSVRPDQPLIGILSEQDGREVVCYFAEETEADAAVAATAASAALALAGVWSDLDWEEAESELDRIRHQSEPTPPITEL